MRRPSFCLVLAATIWASALAQKSFVSLFLPGLDPITNSFKAEVSGVDRNGLTTYLAGFANNPDGAIFTLVEGASKALLTYIVSASQGPVPISIGCDMADGTAVCVAAAPTSTVTTTIPVVLRQVLLDKVGGSGPTPTPPAPPPPPPSQPNLPGQQDQPGQSKQPSQPNQPAPSNAPTPPPTRTSALQSAKETETLVQQTTSASQTGGGVLTLKGVPPLVLALIPLAIAIPFI